MSHLENVSHRGLLSAHSFAVCQPFCSSGFEGLCAATELFQQVFQQRNRVALQPRGFCVYYRLRKCGAGGRRRTARTALETGGGCSACVRACECVCASCGTRTPGAGTGRPAGGKRAVALLVASRCFPSRAGLMTALIMPDGSHQSSSNSRKMSKYCLQNWSVHSFSSL